jgi:hypothetical protein
LFNYILPNRKKLRKIIVYEKSNRSYSELASLRAAHFEAERLLEQHSHHLQEIYASHMVDGKDFLYNYWPDATNERVLQRKEWASLERLYLPCYLESTFFSPEVVQAAAIAAGYMPSLRTMEIKSSESRTRFLYHVDDREHPILAPEEMMNTLDKSTIECWRRSIGASAVGFAVGELQPEDGSGPVRHSLESQSITRTTQTQLSLESMAQKIGLYRLE